MSHRFGRLLAGLFFACLAGPVFAACPYTGNTSNTDSAAMRSALNDICAGLSATIAITVAQTVTASSAYTAGNAVGGLITFSNAARASGAAGTPGTGGLVQSVVVSSKTAQSSQMDLILFNANPSGSTCTDKTAVDVVAADFDKIVGIAHVTDWTALGSTRSAGQAQSLAMPYALVSATALYGCLVTRGTPTFGSTSDITVSLRAIRN